MNLLMSICVSGILTLVIMTFILCIMIYQLVEKIFVTLVDDETKKAIVKHD